MPKAHTAETYLPWQEPLALAANFAADDIVILLYAGSPAPDGSWRSLLALNPRHPIINLWEDLLAQANAADSQEEWQNCWFGYLGYESMNSVASTTSPLGFPPLWMARFSTIYCFDHHQQSLTRYGPDYTLTPTELEQALPVVSHLSSNMSRQEYLDIINATLEQIHQGEFYQANITRKFNGKWEFAPCPFSVYSQLITINPAPYSAFIKIGKQAVISSSPESFLSINTLGEIIARPIKGTAKRSGMPDKDTVIYNQLAASDKNKSENLMIVDLMRHDLSQICQPSSVEVTNLFGITTHPALFHMSSAIKGRKLPSCSNLDVIEACFPPGSMTGAPKRSAIQWCKYKEVLPRGVYSGALGWFSPQGAAELSVIIRTLLINGTNFEFQVGGGIVADSTAEDEWEETLTKAQSILLALKINPEELRLL